MNFENQTVRTPHFGFRATALVAVGFAAATIVLAPITMPTRANAATTASVPTQASAGSVGIRLVDVPADAAADPRARQYIVDELLPGTTIERRIEISNSTDEALTVQAYAAAATISDGAFVGESARTANDLSSWTTLSEPEVVVPAGSTVMNTVTVAIPADAAPGEQYAAVWVQVGGDTGDAIQVVNRVGVRMYVSVGGDNAATSAFVVDTLTASRDDDGNAVVTAMLHNTGGRALDASAALGLTAVGGTLTAGPYTAEQGATIAPGESAPIEVVVTDDLAAGPWLARIEVSSGTLAQSFDAELTFPDEGTADATLARSEQQDYPLWLAMILSIGTLVVVTVGAAATLLVRKHRLELAAAAAAAAEKELV